MDVDEKSQEASNADAAEGQDADAIEDALEVDDLDDDAEDSADVAMVPMADLLNARFESENAKLFYEERALRMVTTKPIKAGEQIWNTYGDPPNSDLLRRYGHVDLVPLRPPLAGEGNPADVVEVRADLVVSVSGRKAVGNTQERVDWWLEEADDDVFVVRTDCQLPDELVSFVRLLFLPQQEWEKTRKKGKLPKPAVDTQVLSVAAQVLEKRLREYPSSIEEDEALLANADTISLNKKHAIIVRLGEKRILSGTLEEVKKLQKQLRPSADAGKNKKRGREAQGDAARGKGKKARR